MERTEPRLTAPQAKGHISSVPLPNAWFIGCLSAELRATPLARVVQGTPLVLFRTNSGKPGALLDRCPHRNVPLSFGRVDQETLRCRYHGWAFDTSGRCTDIPGLCGPPEGKARRAPWYAVAEQDGFVWVYTTPEVEPKDAPYRFPALEDARYSTVRRQFSVRSTMHAAIENTLDVPHTAFLHGGLFRTAKKRNDIEVVVRRTPRQVEAEYLGEPAPSGLIGRLLAPGGGVTTHFDRFILPCVAQVEYRLGQGSHVYASSAMTPETDFLTRVYAVVTFRLPIPGWLVRPFVTPVGLRIFRQDAAVLEQQTQTIQRFGGEQYASTDIDVLGPEIWRMLLEASRGDTPSADVVQEHRLKMRV